MILVLSGSSSSGKNTLIKDLINKNNNLKYIQTFTSRSMRDGESDGNPYYFISKEEFQEKIKNNEFYEYELIHKNYYGVEKNLCLNLLNSDAHLLKDMGVVGTFSLKEQLNNHLVETIFLYVKKHELKHRLKLRGDSKEQIKLRLKRFNFEKSNINKYNYVIKNNNKNNTIEILTKILENNTEFYNYIYFTKPISKINLYKVEKFKNKLINNKKFKPIKVYFDGKDFYLSKNVEKYIAGIILNKNVTKNVVYKSKCFSKKATPEEIVAFVNKLKKY